MAQSSGIFLFVERSLQRVLAFKGSEFIARLCSVYFDLLWFRMMWAWVDICPLSRTPVLLVKMPQVVNNSYHVLLLWVSEHVMATINVSLCPVSCFAWPYWVCSKDEAMRRNEWNKGLLSLRDLTISCLRDTWRPELFRSVLAVEITVSHWN